MPDIGVIYLYDGHPDYWGGDAERWHDHAACAFASYGPETTYRDMIEEWSTQGIEGDIDGKAPWEAVTSEDIQDAIEAVFHAAKGETLDSIARVALDYGANIGHNYEADAGECPCEWCQDRGLDMPQAILLLMLDTPVECCSYCGDSHNIPDPPYEPTLADLAPTGVTVEIIDGALAVKADSGWLGFRIAIDNGPAGIGVTLTSDYGAPDLTTFYGSRDAGTRRADDTTYLEVTQYRTDARSQAFKAWVAGKGEYPATENGADANT